MRAGKAAFILFVVAGLALNLFLLVWRTGGDSVGLAGCGGTGGCQEVLGSRWSLVLGVPVSLPGAVLQAGLLLALHRRLKTLMAPLLVTLAGGVAWFVSIQVLILHHYCPWCLTAHVIGVIEVLLGFRLLEGGRPGRGAFWLGLGLTSTLAAVQSLGPAPATHRLEDSSLTAAGSPIHSRGNGRRVDFNRGRKVYDLGSLPFIGSPDAAHVLVEYFDYQCPSCRIMHGFLESLMAKHPGRIGLLVLPVPLDGTCNHQLTPSESIHPGSCGVARLALAVWRLDPAKFPGFHRALLEGPVPDERRARSLAAEAVSPELLGKAVDDPWIGELLAANISDWVSFSGRTRQLPKLLIKDTRLLHGLPSGEADFIRVIEQELGL